MAENTIYLSADNFIEEVMDSDLPVLVDFYADWCGPCQALGPIIDALADKYQGKAKVCKLNIDENKKLAIKHKVMSIPTMFLFKDGEIKERITGSLPQSSLEQKLDSLL